MTTDELTELADLLGDLYADKGTDDDGVLRAIAKVRAHLFDRLDAAGVMV